VSVEPHLGAALHHDGSSLYLESQPEQPGQPAVVRLRAPSMAPIHAVLVCASSQTGERECTPMREIRRGAVTSWWEGSIKTWSPMTRYRFEVLTNDGTYYVTTRGASLAAVPGDWDFALLATSGAPHWLERSVFYQIFPDRFFCGDPAGAVPSGAWSRSGFLTQRRPWSAPPRPWYEGGNLDFYGGDLWGILQKLDYIQRLGANALYLTPIFPGLSNHRYDVIDFKNVDRYLGGNAALVALRRALTERNMRLLLDIPLNHCSSRHPWFVAARDDAASPLASMFSFIDHPYNYESMHGQVSLPRFDYRNRIARRVMYQDFDSVLQHWLREPYAIDGWRVDAASELGRYRDIQVGHEIGRELRHVLRAVNPNSYLVGEYFNGSAPHLQGDEFDAAMNYEGFAEPLWMWLGGLESEGWCDRPSDRAVPATTVVDGWSRFLAELPWSVARQQLNLLSSHDTPRLLHRVAGNRQLAALAATLLMTYPGVPCIYYGDEIGIEGGQDPDNRRCMLWNEDAWNHELLNHYRRLASWRRTAPALIEGGIQHLAAPDGMIAFQRHCRKQRLLIIAYLGPHESPEASIPVWHAGISDGTVLHDWFGRSLIRVTQGRLVLPKLPPGATLILEAEEPAGL